MQRIRETDAVMRTARQMEFAERRKVYKALTGTAVSLQAFCGMNA